MLPRPEAWVPSPVRKLDPTRHTKSLHESGSVSRSVVSGSATPWTVARQAPLSVGFSRQERWSGLSFPSPEDLPNPGIELGSPALQADSLTSEPPRSPKHSHAATKRSCAPQLRPGAGLNCIIDKFIIY